MFGPSSRPAVGFSVCLALNRSSRSSQFRPIGLLFGRSRSLLPRRVVYCPATLTALRFPIRQSYPANFDVFHRHPASRPLFDNQCGRALLDSPAFSIIVSTTVRLLQPLLLLSGVSVSCFFLLFSSLADPLSFCLFLQPSLFFFGLLSSSSSICC